MNELLLFGKTKPVPSDPYLKFVAWASAYQEIDPMTHASGSPGGSVRFRVTMPENIPNQLGGGSSWGKSWGYYSGEIIAAIAHSFPDITTLAENKASRRVVIMTNAYRGGSGPAPSFTRNGYTTKAAGTQARYDCNEFIYWDNVAQKVMSISPLTYTEPVPFPIP